MEDFFAAICILAITLGFGFLVYDKVFSPVVSSTRDKHIEYNSDKAEELIKERLGKDALVMCTSLESTGNDSNDMVVEVNLDTDEYKILFNTKKVTKDRIYYEPVSIKSINKIH